MPNVNVDVKQDMQTLLSEFRSFKNDMTVFQKDMTDFKKDMTDFKKDMTDFKKDMTDFKNDVNANISIIKNDIASLTDWRRKLSTAAEDVVANLLEYTLSSCYTSLQIDRIFFGKVFTPTGVEITDLDGLFYLKPQTVPKRSINTNVLNAIDFRQKQQHKKEKEQGERLSDCKLTFRNNSSQVVFEPFLIVVEKKLTVDKRHVDEKLEQMIRVQQSFKAAKTSSSSTASTSYQNMVNKFNVGNYPNTMYLVFACDSMSSIVQSYILSINNGLTEATYKTMTFDLLQEDRTYCDFISTCKSICNTQKPASWKNTVFCDAAKMHRKINTFDDLVKVLEILKNVNAGDYPQPQQFNEYLNKLNSFIPYLLKCTKSWLDMQPCFAAFQSQLGTIIGDKVRIPALIEN